MSCLPFLLVFPFTYFPVLPEHPSLNSCVLNEGLYVVLIANSIGVANITLCLPLLSTWPWTFWSISGLGTISKYTFYSALFLDKRTWVQCGLSLLIKQTAYGVASGEASAVDWDELLFTFTPCWRGCYPVLSPPVEVGCWRSGEGPEEGQWRTWSTWPARRGWRSFASCLQWRGYKGVIQQQPVTTAQGFYKGDKSKCFCSDGKMKCHGCT